MLDFQELAYGIHEDTLTAMLKVSGQTIRNWKRGRVRAPYAACVVLHLWRGGDMSTLWGNDWEGFSMRPDAFFHPFWGRGFSAGTMKAFFFRVQTIPDLENECEYLRGQLANMIITAAQAAPSGRITR